MISTKKYTAINNKKVLAAMSGGVDSSVAAVLLKQQGYDLVGITMNLSCVENSSDRSCCSAEAANDAKKVADALGFSHYTLNYKDEFKRFVISNFIDEYKNGRTPNPCVRCNQFLKFDLLIKKAKELGCDYVATGHYARIEPSPLSPVPFPLTKGEGEKGVRGYKLLKGIDSKKDQSYFLYTMGQEALAHTLFPLGELTKDEVRKIARKNRLSVAEKKESQEICFVPDDDYSKYIKENAPELVKPGNIIDTTGKVVGRHDGIAFYTIGQRKGIGAHKGKPKYVVGLDTKRNEVIIGNNDDTLLDNFTAHSVSFINGSIPEKSMEINAKIRYNSKEAPAVLSDLGEKTFKIKFKEPQRALTPGQSVVFYFGDELLGGGIIN
ncbi:tRNA 2-thiouridine(34) synthase MnmA [Candidatus Saganbacteria bacterium]|nr:tRNA 2-thiouridine(34) synthase MnmA [Candidatus Saganbacteria bacterium]